MRKICLFSFLFLIALSFLGIEVQASKIYDGKPAVNGDMLMTSKRTLTVGEKMEFTMNWNMISSGGSLSLGYIEKNSGRSQSFQIYQTYPGVQTVTYEIQPYDIPGEYILYDVQVQDRNGSHTYYNVKDGYIYDYFTKLEFKADMDFTLVNNSYPNDKKPELKAISFDKQSVSRDNKVSAKVHIEDYEKNITSITFAFIGQETKTSYTGGWSGKLSSGIHDISFDIHGNFSIQEDLLLDYIYIYNSFSERNFYEKKDGTEDVYLWLTDTKIDYNNKGITVQKDKWGDSLAPEVKKIYVENPNVTNPGSVKLYLDVKEEGSGLSAIRIGYERENGTKFNYSFSETEINSITNGIHIIFPRYCFGGTYTLKDIRLLDNAGNETYLDIIDVSKNQVEDFYGNTVSCNVENSSFYIHSKEKIDYLIDSENPLLPIYINQMSDGEIAIIHNSNYPSTQIPKSTFESIAGKDITIIYETDSIQWVFDGKKIIKSQCKDINTNTWIYVEEGASYGCTKKVVRIVFMDNGLLPGEALIRIKEDYAYHYLKMENPIYLYYYDNGEMKLVDCTPTAESDGYICFSVKHNSTYLLSPEKKGYENGLLKDGDTSHSYLTYAYFAENKHTMNVTTKWVPTLFYDGYAKDILKFKSSKPSVASVSKSGIITAKKKGTTKVTIYLKNNLKATITIKVTTPKVQLNAKKLPMKIGQKTSDLKIKSKIKTDKVQKWTSSNKNIVSVNKKTGKLTAKKIGTATITVTMKSGAKASCKVKVQKSKVKSDVLRLSPDTITVKKGKTKKINIERIPFTATDKIYYKIKNKKIATVSEKGIIKGRSKGKTTLLFGTNKNYRHEYPVIVK